MNCLVCRLPAPYRGPGGKGTCAVCGWPTAKDEASGATPEASGVMYESYRGGVGVILGAGGDHFIHLTGR